VGGPPWGLGGGFGPPSYIVKKCPDFLLEIVECNCATMASAFYVCLSVPLAYVRVLGETLTQPNTFDLQDVYNGLSF
jgi:hypothetical protein